MASALSVTPTCPRCKRVIPSEDINVANNIAFCRNCNLSNSLSALMSGAVVDENVDVSRPPAGTWFQRTGDGVVLGATNRSLGAAIGLLFFCLFWNGVVLVFVLLAAASTLHHLGVTPPAWVPRSFSKGNYPPLAMTIFLWLFLTPFITVGLTMFCSLLSCIAGRTEIRTQGREGALFSGVGPLGFRKRFSLSDLRDIRIEDRCWQSNRGNSQRKTEVVLETNNKPIRFGSMLTTERRRFIAATIKQELVRR